MMTNDDRCSATLIKKKSAELGIELHFNISFFGSISFKFD